MPFLKKSQSPAIYFSCYPFCVPDEVLDRLYTLSPHLKNRAFSLHFPEVSKNAQNQAFYLPNFRRYMQI